MTLQHEPTPEPTTEMKFRESLEDTVIILRKLAPLCKDVDELIGMMELAMSNDAQLSLLIREVFPVKLRR